MTKEERAGLIGQLGADVTNYDAAAVQRKWPLARMFLTRMTAAMGALAMEVDEYDPVERET